MKGRLYRGAVYKLYEGGPIIPSFGIDWPSQVCVQGGTFQYSLTPPSTGGIASYISKPNVAATRSGYVASVWGNIAGGETDRYISTLPPPYTTQSAYLQYTGVMANGGAGSGTIVIDPETSDAHILWMPTTNGGVDYIRGTWTGTGWTWAPAVLIYDAPPRAGGYENTIGEVAITVLRGGILVGLATQLVGGPNYVTIHWSLDRGVSWSNMEWPGGYAGGPRWHQIDRMEVVPAGNLAVLTLSASFAAVGSDRRTWVSVFDPATQTVSPAQSLTGDYGVAWSSLGNKAAIAGDRDSRRFWAAHRPAAGAGDLHLWEYEVSELGVVTSTDKRVVGTCDPSSDRDMVYDHETNRIALFVRYGTPGNERGWLGYDTPETISLVDTLSMAGLNMSVSLARIACVDQAILAWGPTPGWSNPSLIHGYVFPS